MGKKRLVLTVFVLLCVLLLAGCGNPYAQVWCCAYMETDLGVMTAGDMDNAGTELYLDLRSNGVGYMTADGETQRIGWAESTDGKALILNVDGNQERFEIEGDSLNWIMEDVTVTFLPEKSEAYKEALGSFSIENRMEDIAGE